MLTCDKVFSILEEQQLTFFTGVPDSTFKDWLVCLKDRAKQGKVKHMLACNETTAVGLAAGYHLATQQIPICYMQNSGLGNTVNPLTSLADKEIYSIPMILFIGWRGEPGHQDEPQHKKMGRITLDLLHTLEIPVYTLPENNKEQPAFWAKVKQNAQEEQSPVAVLTPKGIFHPYPDKEESGNSFSLQREQVIKQIVDSLSGQEAIVSTTGKPSRELYEYRDAKQQGHQNDFYTVGSLGCVSAIALSIASEKPDKKVLIFDADGSLLMHTGMLATVGTYGPSNIRHIVFDNEAHESTGGQATYSDKVNFAKMALACGYHQAHLVKNQDELDSALPDFLEQPGPCMLLIKMAKGSRSDLGRPKTTPIENKRAFMNFLRNP